MEKYINEAGKSVWKGVDENSVFSADMFYEVEMKSNSNRDKQLALHTNLGSITVLDRLTGYIGHIRDIESGYRDVTGKFWLASGGCNVIESDCKTVGDAIAWVKQRANTCVGV